MYFFYSLLLGLAALISLPWWLLQMARLGKYRAGFRERMGAVPARLKIQGAGDCIWIHAVSVGEVLAISQLVSELEKRQPEWQIVVSTTTATGQALARQRFGQTRVFYMPLDFRFALRPYLKALRPRMLVLAETEFWPNLLHLAKLSGAAVAVVNARISDRSSPRYRRFRWFFWRILANIDLFLAQTEEDACRLKAIGAPEGRVFVTGNLKFDIKLGVSPAITEQLRRVLPQDTRVIVCGSTTEGEEELVLAAFRQVLEQFPNTTMILAPRHPERFEKVAALIASAGLPFVKRSTWDSEAGAALGAGSIFLLDSVGELASVYALADLAFVGGSLVPLGGHNILEPAQHGVAVLTGPHTFNFREIVRIFEAGGGLRVVGADDLSASVMNLLNDDQERELLGRRARELFLENTGATGKTITALQLLLNGTPVATE
jgi:3-deoxy-D-manno-octulosonic-acid transferase